MAGSVSFADSGGATKPQQILFCIVFRTCWTFRQKNGMIDVGNFRTSCVRQIEKNMMLEFYLGTQHRITGKENKKMKTYVCGPCGYEYDPAVGDPDNDIAPGTAFADLPEDWVCPICGAGKEEFEEA